MEVAATRIKRLEWRFWANGFPPFWEGSTGPFGYYCIEEASALDDDEEPTDEPPVFSIIDPMHRHIGVKRTLEEAQTLCQQHFESNARKILE